MTRPRQKRKNRSGLQRIKQRTKSKKQVFNNAVIAANWNKSQTLSQNYKRLGLTVKLNKQSGGVEKDVATISQYNRADGRQVAKLDSLTIASTPGQRDYGLDEVRVERDPESGRITRVVMPELTTRSNPLNDPLNDLDPDSDEEEESHSQRIDQGEGRAREGNTAASLAERTDSDVVVELERRANMPAEKYRRRQTDNERRFIEELVQKYGFEYDRMARDIKLNYMQRSAGDLKRRIKKWQENGGKVT